MQIGTRFLRGEEVYGENSYYPLPFVMIFAGFAALPRPVSMALWLFLPVIVAWWISGWKLWVLLYAPLIAHFLGGQTAVFGMIGLWGYRQRQKTDHFGGGIWLALTLIKPQLGLLPLSWAISRWWKAFRGTGQIPKQFLGWVAAMIFIYGIPFLVAPDWLSQWLSHPRPLFERALAGFVPRGLVMLGIHGWAFWGLWVIITLLSFVWILKHVRQKLDLDLLTLWYFCISPLVHDYDLIQMIPLLDSKRLQWGAVMLGVPTLLVILFAYGIDQAWAVVTIIAPGLWILKFKEGAYSTPSLNT
ncbi:hypothetical protein [Anaerolinea thermolimosa]|nr:hypothetical protein [Anaerolinea thermolimosa]